MLIFPQTPCGKAHLPGSALGPASLLDTGSVEASSQGLQGEVRRAEGAGMAVLARLGHPGLV